MTDVGKPSDDMNSVVEFPGPRWTTPLNRLPDMEVGRAALKHYKQKRNGYYSMEGTLGFEIYQVTEGPMPVSDLRIDGKTWMVDDPMHWFAMREAVMDLATDMSSGEVMYVAGLGLGLLVHHVAPIAARFSRIVVVELVQDVIDLIKPTLPEVPNLEIINADWWDFVASSERPGGVFWDLAVGGPNDTAFDIWRAKIVHEARWHDVPLWRFGVRKTPTPGWMRGIREMVES